MILFLSRFLKADLQRLRMYKVVCVLFVLFTTILSGCAGHQSLYYWGDYEADLLTKFTDPGEIAPIEEIHHLEKLVQTAQSEGKRIPPGVWIQLAMLYANQGNDSAARKAILSEKAAFPEARIFVDGIVQRAKEKKYSGVRANTNE